MSICNELSDAPSVDDQILDAARSCVLDFGLRRTTLAEVARRAGVSRPTVYRRWPDTRAVVADLLTREIRVVIPDMDGDEPARVQLVRAVVEVATGMREHPLFVKILRSDPDLLMTYIVDRLGTSQRAIVERVSQAVTAGQIDGSIRAGDPVHIAAMVLLIAQSAVQSAGMVAEVLPPEALTAELAVAVDTYLAPR
ncbi:TetR/AcrR family transcriptional regulator [Prescottella equi]|uniref:Transcriptional regulator, TetR family n=1 Tax=Prescottella equi ATCC 33707 TaxID=525370 RepID=E9SVF2_RHOHA|nr:TetR/AcrR family transcriptional regulator [Prescottella equi]EGD26286.1 transcriptional regulator, TetR family [Prescottella equi ATCC 33707]MBM4722196.1 TetR family transcriptional regulator [Prescottella equi]NKR56038.1 TetR family transcriptional regulator [Prescottella equi]ORL11216.1 TetR family transcriptional regulator [Prescottella equi]BCN43759.1 putative transcriptional regulator, TetR family protein [Prescottella equi]